MRVAIAQVRGQMDDPPSNVTKAKMLLNNTDVDLLIFPEMFATGYDKNCMQWMKNIDALFMNRFNTTVANKKCFALFGCPVLEDGKLYNCAVLTDGTDRQIYKKIHLDTNEKFSEKDVFAAGSVPKIFKIGDLRIGMAVGSDLMFNELFRWYAANDVDMVICIAALSKQVIDRYERILPARCVDNSLEMVFVNMVGPDPGFTLAGGSKYVSSDGAVLEMCSDSSDVRIIKLDTERMKRSKEGRGFLKRIRNDIDWSV